MAAVREIHGQDAIARFDGGEIDRHVGLRSAMRLHVDMLGAEDFQARSIANCSTTSTFSQPPYQRFPG